MPMNKEQMKRFATDVAKLTTAMVVKELKRKNVPTETEYVGTEEAARILGVSPNYLRQVKDRYTHIKRGENNQGRLLFKREALLEGVGSEKE